MITETSPKTELLTEVTPDWEPPIPPTDLIFDDREPLESKRHRIAMNVLINLLYQDLRKNTMYRVCVRRAIADAELPLTLKNLAIASRFLPLLK